MPRRIEWTEDQLAELRRRYEAGDSWRKIAASVGINEATARGKVHALGLPLRRLSVDQSWRKFRWTPELDAVIVERYAAGTAVRLIADELGVGKNQVIGRAGRLGLKHKKADIWAPRKPRPPKPPKPERQQRRRIQPVAIVPPMFGLANQAAAAVMALRRRQCRWIEGDVMLGHIAFCENDARPGSSYCEAHRQATIKAVPDDAAVQDTRVNKWSIRVAR